MKDANETIPATPWTSHARIDQAWLAKMTEPVLDPDLPIIDAHHHLWSHPHHHYLLPELLQDLGDGHRIEATVYVEASSRYDATGPEDLRPVGETRFATETAEAARSAGKSGVCAAIVAFARLRLGSRVAAVLEAHLDAGHVRGIRNVTTWDPITALQSKRSNPGPEMLRDAKFREGYTMLGRYGLAFESWLYHTQLDELIELADAFPDTPIVINHLGGPIGLEGYPVGRDEVFKLWTASVRSLAQRPKVFMKLGGLGLPWAGFGLRDRPKPAPSTELADAWRPYVETAIELFSPSRCMFQSNFPLDNEAYTYRTIWNAYKRLAAPYSPEERSALFYDTACDFYDLRQRI